jgi:O-antigen ligase
MPSNRQVWDYESVTPAAHAEVPHGDYASADEPSGRASSERERGSGTRATGMPKSKTRRDATPSSFSRGHAVTYALLFLFTVVLYLRPADFYPSPLTNSIALIVGTATLVVFLIAQVSLEGNLTARPREVNLALLFCLLALLSIPFAIEPARAWTTFSGTFIRCIIIFVVMVNAMRTLPRLRGLLWVALATGFFLSIGALGDYRSGKFAVEGYRVGGVGEGIFANPNDLALFFVTGVPMAVGLLLGSRSLAGKALYALAALLMVTGMVVTFSRGAFLGLIVALAVMAWKVGRRNRTLVVLGGFACLVLFFVIAPGSYALRLLSIFVPGLDPVGSSDMRQQILLRSVWTAIRHPLLGVGMGNFPLVSFHDLVSHNSYTQVASEMGLPALAVYLLFLWTPLKGLRKIERETFEARKRSRFYYLAVGTQAALVCYMVSSFFASVAYLWYVYYIVGYAVCLRRIYDGEEAAKAEAESHIASVDAAVEDVDVPRSLDATAAVTAREGRA